MQFVVWHHQAEVVRCPAGSRGSDSAMLAGGVFSSWESWREIITFCTFGKNVVLRFGETEKYRWNLRDLWWMELVQLDDLLSK